LLRKSTSLEDFVIWTYSRQRVIEVTGKALLAGEREVERDSFAPPLRRHSLDGLAAVGRIAELGCMIDNDRPPRGGVYAAAVHPDAELLHDAVLSLPVLMASEIVRFGRGGEIPDYPGPPKLVPVTEHNGRKLVVKQSSRYDFELRCKLSWCPVVIINDDIAVAQAFSAYSHWWNSLYKLLVEIADIEFRNFDVWGMDHTEPNPQQRIAS
jgi:hypothetical protein